MGSRQCSYAVAEVAGGEKQDRLHRLSGPYSLLPIPYSLFLSHTLQHAQALVDLFERVVMHQAEPQQPAAFFHA